jgi:hypothetical protein
MAEGIHLEIQAPASQTTPNDKQSATAEKNYPYGCFLLDFTPLSHDIRWSFVVPVPE